MTQTTQTPHIEPQPVPKVNPVPGPGESTQRDRHAVCALLSVIITVIAWITLMFEGYTALALALIGIVLGLFGLRSRRRLARNASITAIVASGVLCVVVTSFLIVIFIGLQSI